MCGAKQGGLSLDGIDVAKEAVIQGQVLRGDEPVGNAYVRLLDRTGEFTAEVPTSATGHFRFFAAPGEWTLRTLAPKADTVDKKVVAQKGVVAEVAIPICSSGGGALVAVARACRDHQPIAPRTPPQPRAAPWGPGLRGICGVDRAFGVPQCPS